MEAQVTQYNAIMPEVQEMIATHMDIRTFFTYAMCTKETLRQTKACILLNHKIAEFICNKLYITKEDLYKIRDLSEFTFKEIMVDSKIVGIMVKAFPNLTGLEFDEVYGDIGTIDLPESIKTSNAIQRVTITLNRSAEETESILQLLGNFPQVTEFKACNLELEEDELSVRFSGIDEVEKDIHYRFKETPLHILKKFFEFPSSVLEKDESLRIVHKFVINLIREREIEEKELVHLKKIDLTRTIGLDDELELDSKKWKETPFLDSLYYLLVKKSPNLETLILNECHEIRKIKIFTAFLDHFPECPMLKNLHLRSTAITVKDLERIAKKCPNLEFIDLTDCSLLADEDIEKFTVLRSELYPNKNPVTINREISDEDSVEI